MAWYLTDRLGSVRDLTDGSGVVQDHLEYDSFGKVTTETSPSFGDRYKWTGREHDSTSGLQYNRARYYDSTVGRWTSEDPLHLAAGDTNLYRYVSNQPTNATDPLGLHSVGPSPDVYQTYIRESEERLRRMEKWWNEREQEVLDFIDQCLKDGRDMLIKATKERNLKTQKVLIDTANLLNEIANGQLRSHQRRQALIEELRKRTIMERTPAMKKALKELSDQIKPNINPDHIKRLKELTNPPR